jgi:hypothetical protein
LDRVSSIKSILQYVYYKSDLKHKSDLVRVHLSKLLV